MNEKINREFEAAELAGMNPKRVRITVKPGLEELEVFKLIAGNTYSGYEFIYGDRIVTWFENEQGEIIHCYTPAEQADGDERYLGKITRPENLEQFILSE